jgi:HK97 family phage prohead protease
MEISLEIKSVAVDGTFEGFASTYGNVDKQQDRIDVGAFKADDGKEVPLLWSHDRTQPVGLGKLEESAEGVKVHGRLNLDTAGGREAYSNLKKGIVKALSIGFELAAHAFDGAVRVIKQGVIREVSLVIFPANPAAVVTAVKGEPCAAKELIGYLQ